MKVSVILAHPSDRSLNYAIADTAVKTLEEAGHAVFFHDLHFENFDPVLRKKELYPDVVQYPEVERHCVELGEADGLIIVHPNWWGMPPAVMTGWIDRIFRAGVAYKFVENDCGEGVPVGLLKLKTAVIFNTSNTPPEREKEAFGDPLELIWKKCVFGLCGVTDVHRRCFSVVCTSTDEERAAWLAEVADTVRKYFPA